MRETLGRLHLLEALRPRRFQAYGCGAGKTGTHSICNIFHQYRTGHESDIERTVKLATAYLDGSISDREVGQILRRRDWRLWLEMDSSLVNGFLVGPLARTFPAARFILTVREPLSWTESLMNHELNRGRPDFWLKYDQLTWDLDRFDYTPHDRVLEERGLRPLASYFHAWARHNSEVLNSAPEERLLVLRTHHIGDRLNDIAAHVGVASNTLVATLSKSYAAPNKHEILPQLDQNYVRDLAERQCGELTRLLFPDPLSQPKDYTTKV